MSLRQETIERVCNMPDIVGRLRSEVLPIEDISEALPTLETIFHEESYGLSAEQREIKKISICKFMIDRGGILYALQDDNIDRVNEELARQHNIAVGHIADTTVHPTSLTFVLHSSAFANVYDPERKFRRDGYAHREFPLGFTNNAFSLPIDGYRVKYSFRDAYRSDGSTAEHENFHVIYNYFHPSRFFGELPTEEEHTEYAQNIYREQNKKSFKRQLDYLSCWQMYRYLDEQTASSLRGRRIVDQFVGDRADGDYTKAYNDRLTALRMGLPADLKERFDWERMMWKSQARLTHWMQFVDKEYKELLHADADIPFDEHTNILLTLTPDRAYLIRFFNPQYADAPLNDLLQWGREYHSGWEPKTTHERVNDWTEFFISILELDDHELLPALQEFNGQVRSRKRELIWQDKSHRESPEYFADAAFDSENLEEINEAVRSTIAGKISRSVGIYEDYLDQQELSDDERRIIRFHLAKRIFNAHALFHKFLDSYLFMNDSYTGEDLHELYTRGERRSDYENGVREDQIALVKRYFELEDAAADMMEAYIEGEEIDLNYFLEPGYRRSDEKYERLIHLLLNNQIETVRDISPLDREYNMFFRYQFRTSRILASYEGETVSPRDIHSKVSATLTRILIWAREKNISDERIAEIEEYFLRLKKEKIISQEYQAIIDQASTSDPETQ